MAGPAPMGIVESFVAAHGDEMTDLCGQRLTFLAAPLGKTDTTIVLDSTYRWPDSGFIRIGQERIPYGARDATHVYATARAPDAVAYPTGKLCYEDSRTVSLIDSARMQMSAAHATGKYLKAMISNVGLPLPPGLTDAQLRAYLRVGGYPAAGPRRTIARMLTAVLQGQLRTCSIVSNTLVLTDGSTWPAIAGRLVRVLSPSSQAGLYRLGSLVSTTVAKLDPADGTYYDAGLLADATDVPIELVPWDLWEHPDEECRFHIDLLRWGDFVGIEGAAYVQGGEQATSTDVTHVTVLAEPLQVLGVWLATDVLRSGTNYWTGGSFAGPIITLGTALPGATTSVIVDYGAAEYTAYALPNASIDGTTYYPFYLTDPSMGLSVVIDVVRAAGYLPTFSLTTV
jgi:hypothetical protein